MVGATSPLQCSSTTLTAGEFVFVADSPDAGEDEGWLMGFVYDAALGRSSLVVLDASDLAAGPVATVPLPARVPAGFHGNWVPAAALGER